MQLKLYLIFSHFLFNFMFFVKRYLLNQTMAFVWHKEVNPFVISFENVTFLGTGKATKE